MKSYIGLIMIYNLCKCVRFDNRTFQASTTKYFVLNVIDLKCSVYILISCWSKTAEFYSLWKTTRPFNFEVRTITEVYSVNLNRSVKYDY